MASAATHVPVAAAPAAPAMLTAPPAGLLVLHCDFRAAATADSLFSTAITSFDFGINLKLDKKILIYKKYTFFKFS